MSLKRLYYFTVLAEELHFGRAAVRLHLAQPGLSQQIKTLEAELGVQLLERGRGETRLTPSGELLEREGRTLLQDATRLTKRVRGRDRGYASQFRIAYTRSATYLGTTEAVAAFRRLNPEVKVETTTAWTALNLNMLRAHEVDVAFVRPPLREDDMETLILLEEELVVALPAHHPMVNKETITVTDVRDEPIVMWPREYGSGHYERIISQIWGAQHPKVAVEEPDDVEILAAVAQGAGIAIVELRRGMRLRPAGVVLRRFSNPVPTSLLAAAWLRGSSSPLLEGFLKVCRHMQPQPSEAPVRSRAEHPAL